LSATTFLAFGDSITEGVVSPPGAVACCVITTESYPYKLQALLSARYTSQTITLVNAGKGGESATDGAQRLPGVLTSLHPDVLLLMDGTNELGAGNGGIPAATAALTNMINQAKSAGIVPVLATYPPQQPGTRTGSNPTGSLLNQAIRDLAAAQHVMLIDVAASFDPALMGIDGLHPTAAGYTQVANTFYDAIRTSFEGAKQLIAVVQ
jgi:lysophospholipase L1-like esterase